MNTSRVFNKAEITFWLIVMNVITLIGSCLTGRWAAGRELNKRHLPHGITLALAGLAIGFSIGFLIRLWLAR